MRHPRSAHRGAYTLVELVVSMSVATILMGGLASTIVLASRAMPGQHTPARSTIDGYYATEQIAGELLCAQSFTVRTPTAVEFIVADRSGDDVGETIRYEWSGTPGDALTRQYNSGSILDIAEDLNEFALTYNTRIETTTTTKTLIARSDDINLAYFTTWSGITPAEYPLSSDRWMAEYFQFTFPEGVPEMDVTRVMLMMKAGTFNPSATVTVGVHRPITPGDPRPQASPIGTPAVRLTTSLYPSFLWTEFTFTDVKINSSDTELVIVVKGTTFGTAYSQQYYWKSAPADTKIYTWTTDAGGSWDPRASLYDDYEMPFSIFGSYETETTQEITIDHYFLESVGITLRVGSNAAARVETAAQVLNQPEVTGS